jgi:hypothetical protein
VAGHGVLPPGARVSGDPLQRPPLPELAVLAQLVQRPQARDEALVLAVEQLQRNLGGANDITFLDVFQRKKDDFLESTLTIICIFNCKNANVVAKN